MLQSLIKLILSLNRLQTITRLNENLHSFSAEHLYHAVDRLESGIWPLQSAALISNAAFPLVGLIHN